MRPRVKSSVLWGAVGAFAFLALTQGYVLVGGRLPLSFPRRLVVAVVLGVVVVGVAYVTEYRVAQKGRT
ncbi:hypothetical protein SAMN04487948_103110 [Halogranum amylolyticum]|uniref:DUF7981 domain-containing protein n=1 Tax=Halogranum amylolyticum TaxID=660520 RepID=A0A1H8QGA6_9EURY|nr:hypothetical protein [Halogranum amylolyticum]SEO53260.1 hypothetical protein SAMN04487948_103110 [Halogranum amylolyticum]